MYVCLCHPFSDKDVRKALGDPKIRKTPAGLYKACSGGCAPQCGNCLCHLQTMIWDHVSGGEQSPFCSHQKEDTPV